PAARSVPAACLPGRRRYRADLHGIPLRSPPGLPLLPRLHPERGYPLPLGTLVTSQVHCLCCFNVRAKQGRIRCCR
ncbi:hypothetical protein BGW38_009422, partial [Lunasporangiospora selenospora]